MGFENVHNVRHGVATKPCGKSVIQCARLTHAGLRGGEMAECRVSMSHDTVCIRHNKHTRNIRVHIEKNQTFRESVPFESQAYTD